MNVTKQQLLDMIVALREQVEALTGAPRGEITMHEYMLAERRGDKVTMQRFLNQFKDPAFLERWKAQAVKDGFLKGGSHVEHPTGN